MPTLQRWWMNPLLHHARRSAPLPPSVLRVGIPVLAGALWLIALLAWVLNLRAPGAVVMALSVGAVALPIVVAPLVSSHRVASQMANPQQDPRHLSDLDPHQVAWGLSLVTLWQLRWLIVVALAVVPALMVGVLHITTADFQVWRDSAALLGDSGGRATYLSASGGIPYFRLILQTISVGLLPWVLLPLMASMGVLVALLLEDLLISDLAALLVDTLVCITSLVTWSFLMRTPFLAQAFEPFRLLFFIVMIVCWLLLCIWMIGRSSVILQTAALNEQAE